MQIEAFFPTAHICEHMYKKNWANKKDKSYKRVDVLMNKVDKGLKIVPKFVEFSQHFWSKVPNF